MAIIFKKYSNVTLVFFAVFFLAVIVGYVTWAVGVFATEAGVAFSLSAQPVAKISFDLKDAATLDLRGLAN
jgi:hypothetical protein